MFLNARENKDWRECIPGCRNTMAWPLQCPRTTYVWTCWRTPARLSGAAKQMYTTKACNHVKAIRGSWLALYCYFEVSRTICCSKEDRLSMVGNFAILCTQIRPSTSKIEPSILPKKPASPPVFLPLADCVAFKNILLWGMHVRGSPLLPSHSHLSFRPKVIGVF